MLSMVDWPLTGRTEELAEIARALRPDSGYGGVVIAGGPGLGKTRLAAEAIRIGRNHGWFTHSVTATAAAQSIPLGAFAQWIDGIDGTNGADGQLVGLVSLVIAALTAVPEGKAILITVDDAQLLDDTSALVIHQLVRRRAALILMTVRTGQPTTETVSELWKDGLLERLDLEPLSEHESGALLKAALGGPVDTQSTRKMWNLTRGNTLFLYQLVHQELHAGRLTFSQTAWRWSGTMTVSPTVIDLVDHYVGAAPADTLEVMDLVAVAEPLELGYLAAIVASSAIEDAERRELIAVEANSPNSVVRFTHPLYGEVRRAHMGQMRAARLRGRLARAMTNPRPGTKPADKLRLALLWLESDLAGDADILRNGAAEAFLRLDLDLTNRLCEGALGAGAGIDARILYALSLYSVGHAAEAEAVLDALPTPTPDFFWVIAVTIKAANRQFFLAQPEKSWAIIDEAIAAAAPEIRPQIETLRVTQLAMAARPAEAVRAAEALNAHWLGALAASIVACGEMIAFGDLGKPDAATAAVHTCIQRAGGDPQAAHQMVALNLLYADALILGGLLDQAGALGQRLLSEWADTPRDPSAVAAAIVGTAALANGDLTVAQEQLANTIANVGSRHDISGGLYLFWLVYTEALARGGQIDAAVDALGQVESYRHPSYTFVESNRLRVAGWVAAAQGRTVEAVSLACEAADFARKHGQFAREVMSLQTAIQFGDTRHTTRLAELSAITEGPRAPLVSRWSIALASADGNELLEVSTGFELMGDRIAAADAAAHAALSFGKSNMERSRLSASARATRIITECRGVTPATQAATRPLTLSDREQQIATMVSQGRTNRQIADDLVMSVRTVEGHVYRACAKLGLKNRSELSKFIKEFAGKSPP